LTAFSTGRSRPRRRSGAVRSLENEGYRVRRFWNEEVMDDIDGVLEQIAQLL
jgi:very-short-patch-repair endonuclease